MAEWIKSSLVGEEEQALIVPPHPARYSEELWPSVIDLLCMPLPDAPRLGCLLDPFGGVGGIFFLQAFFPSLSIEAVEIEADWARADRRITLGSALALPWDRETFDAIVTSPTYGNRMADDFVCSAGGGGRNTYRHKLGHALHPENSGGMQWGDEYREFHWRAWTEVRRVLRPGGAVHP